ncbi:protein of unknown function (plasmid) [Azospirillum lipoferum 4B]|uniref:Uncharacterized protein n=1 Tax=Azospirillum lipoferum (strain 4B) TaxID=862719 RepID=G7ZG15_AZOL4|nr:protein of unknown function [Azospirillum lipoferum 4B]
MKPPVAGDVPVETPEGALAEAAGPLLTVALAKDTPRDVPPPDPVPPVLRVAAEPVPDAVPAVPSLEPADGSAASPLAICVAAADFFCSSCARRPAARRYSSTTRWDGIWSWVSPVSKSRK